MKRKRLAKSLRKYIRREKSRIRRQTSDLKEQKKLIDELYQRFSKTSATGKKNENTRNLQSGSK